MPTVSASTVKTPPCPGSGAKVGQKGRKRAQYGYKYPCPECGGLYGKNAKGLLNKHGQKRLKVEAICADCRGPIFELDYLCEECRSK